MNLNAKGHTQEVTVADNWLTDGNGTFCKVACLPEGTNWAECTTAEKEEWERLHPQPEPEPSPEPEPEPEPERGEG